MTHVDPSRVAASFDSATVLQQGLAAALRGQAFRHLGHSRVAAVATRAAAHLPWPLLRQVYTRIGAAEAVRSDRLADIDLSAVAQWLVGAYPHRRYPAVLVGSSNGALAHLAAAMQTPWLPGTVLVPVARVADPRRAADACEFGRRHAPALLDGNPEITLHHMHDQVQDELMVSRMTYFRTKWNTLPDAYADYLGRALLPDAPVVLVEDHSTWPVVRVGERHVFQVGAQGGLEPADYLDRDHTPQPVPRPDDVAPEAEWGADPGLGAAVQAWCHDNGHPLVRIGYRGPQAPAHAVATVMREWYRRRGEPADRLLVPSFILGDPWRTLTTASVPYWTFFSVRPALDALADHLQRSTPYRHVDLLLFNHGADSEGIAVPAEWEDTVRQHGARPRLLALDRRRFPHDIGSNARYSQALDTLPGARQPWSPLAVPTAMTGLRDNGIDVQCDIW